MNWPLLHEITSKVSDNTTNIYLAHNSESWHLSFSSGPVDMSWALHVFMISLQSVLWLVVSSG